MNQQEKSLQNATSLSKEVDSLYNYFSPEEIKELITEALEEYTILKLGFIENIDFDLPKA